MYCEPTHIQFICIWNSGVGIGTRLLAEYIEEPFHSRRGTKDSLLERAQANCTANHPSHSKGTAMSLPGVNRPGRDANDSPQFSAGDVHVVR